MAAKKPSKSSAKKSSAKKASKTASKTSKKQSSGGSSSGAEAAAQRPRFPRRIYAVASTRSIGGVSMFDSNARIDADNIADFDSAPGVAEAAAARLEAVGIDVLQVTGVMLNLSGSRTAFERAFGQRLQIEQRETVKSFGRQSVAEFIECPETDVPGLIVTEGTDFEDVLEGVAIEEPRYLMAASPYPPSTGYWHLDVPGDVSLGCNADQAHRAGITGADVTVAMVDSGWFRHPFFTQRGYRADDAILGPGTSDPLVDENGHGTGESANVFAVAPDARLLPVKAQLAGTLNTVLVNATGAFNNAVALAPDIITNSWGFSFETGPLSAASQALAASVAAASASGIVVVFSAGNGHWGFPGQHPDVISAGGVHMKPDGSLEASNYSSGFDSTIYPGRRVPDVSGLVGMTPGAQYIMLPVAEGSQLDEALAGGSHPNGDETPADDGWAAFSGTSAAAPMVAGAAALILQACPSLSPAEVRSILMSTARDVTEGSNALGNVAVEGPDNATGDGLIDVHKAVLVAKLRCGVAAPEPTPPAPGVEAPPSAPTPPAEIAAAASARSVPSVGGRVQPLLPGDGVAEATARKASRPGVGLTADDVGMLERMVIAGDAPFMS